jgi:arabinoxylan arabinofuranohydrolase
MTSKSPLGPFTFKETILKNPGFYYGLGGNNHHAIFKFKDKWYITYHTRMLEKEIGVLHGYRSTSIEEFEMGEDGTIGSIPMKNDAREQVGTFDPYQTINAATFSSMGGVDTAPADEVSKECGSGNMLLTSINTGDFVEIAGVDFGDKGATKVTAKVNTNGCEGAIRVTVGYINKEVVGYIPVKGDGCVTIEANLDTTITGLQNVFFTFSGEGYEVLEWKFE